jgi:hypothetical protein
MAVFSPVTYPDKHNSHLHNTVVYTHITSNTTNV